MQNFNQTCLAITTALWPIPALIVSAVVAPAADAKDSRCFEMRTYYAAPGKLAALQARFRDHTCKLFEQHGLVNLGYWVPLDNPDQKIVYILISSSREAHEQSWKVFKADPEWQAVVKESEKDGKLLAKVESVFLAATDFSPEIKPSTTTPPLTFEVRTYVASPGKGDSDGALADAAKASSLDRK